MCDPVWFLLALLQGPAPLPAPPLPSTVDVALLPSSARWDLHRQAPPSPPVATTQVKAPPAPTADRVRGKAELSYVSTGGTTSTQTLGTGGEVVVSAGPWRVESRASFLRTQTDDVVRARRVTGQVKSAHRMGDRAELFARGTYLRNTFAGIDHGVDGAAGVTALLLRSAPQRLSLDSAVGYTGEDRTRGQGRYLATVDLGLRHQWEFTRRNRLSNDASVKTDVERTTDWRVSYASALQAALNAVLALKLSYEINYRNEPVPGFTRADTVTAAAIVATF